LVTKLHTCKKNIAENIAECMQMYTRARNLFHVGCC